MGRRAKSHEPIPLIRECVAQNVERLRDRKFKGATVTARNKALAKAAGTSLSQVQRIVERKSGVGLDGIEKFAVALGCRPQDLLTPYFATQGVTDRPDLNDPEPRSPMFSERRAS